MADEHWIPLYSSRDYVLLSCDRQQVKDAVIARAIASCGARMIYLPAAFANMRRWDQALWIPRHWWRIVDAAGLMKQGELLVLSRTGKAKPA